MIADARGLGMRVMMDFVINHTAFDSPLLTEHPTWYRRKLTASRLIREQATAIAS